MRKTILMFVFVICLITCGCQHKATNSNDSINSTATAFVEGEKTTHIKQILKRYIEGINSLGDDAHVKITGPITKEDHFYILFVDTIPANGYGFKEEIKFYAPEPEIIEKSFSITFPKDYNMQSLRNFITLTIFAVEPNMSYENAEKEMNKMIANYTNDSPSNIYIGSEYNVYVAPANIVSGYTVEAVCNAEINEEIDVKEYKALEYSHMASELNKGVSCHINATPYEIIVNYPYVYIRAKDSKGNLYYFSSMYNDVLNNINKNEKYEFYFSLSGKVINNEIYCGLRYYE